MPSNLCVPTAMYVHFAYATNNNAQLDLHSTYAVHSKPPQGFA